MRLSRIRGNIAALLAVCLVALAGCAGPAGPGILGGGTCSLEQVARVPVRFYSGLPLVDATIAGAPVRLVLDTGADRTLLSEAAVRRLGLPRDPHRTSRSAGVGGVFGGFDAIVNTITLGGTTLPLPRVVVGDFNLGFSDTQVDGLLGADLWRHFDVDLDLPARTATLYRAQFCHRTAPPWPGPAIAIEGLAGPPTRLLLPVALDGKGAAAIFDTGAQVTGVSTRLAASVPNPPILAARCGCGAPGRRPRACRPAASPVCKSVRCCSPIRSFRSCRCPGSSARWWARTCCAAAAPGSRSRRANCSWPRRTFPAMPAGRSPLLARQPAHKTLTHGWKKTMCGLAGIFHP